MNQPSEKNLFEKYGNGTLTAQELLLLHNWYFEQSKSVEVYPDPDVYQKRMEEMDSAIFAHLNAARKMRLIKYGCVAFLLVAASFTFYFMLRNIRVKNYDTLYATEIAPGGNKAKLILANGRSINLTNARIGELADQDGVKITKSSDGELIYTVTDTKSGNNGYHKIETPKGGQYRVCLPDGTKVWLNAASTLRYPATFSSLSERRVTLSGEAYFEVSHDDKQPFIVQTARQTVRDIGTKFNISSYTEEPGIKTTVLEGAAAVSPTLLPAKHHSGRRSPGATHALVKVLKAGQQAVVTAEGIEVADINAEESISWTNGLFQFQNDDLQTGMRQIARWYNVGIVYQGAVPTEKLDGKVYRNISLSKALEILLSPTISYKIENRKVMIMSNK